MTRRARSRARSRAPSAIVAITTLTATVALLGTPATAVWAQTAADAGARADHRMTLAAVLAVALRQNPDLAIARASTDSARAELRGARALPNPVYASTPNTPYQYGITLPLDVGPQRVYRTRAAQRGVSAVQLDARDSVRQLTFAVRRAFIDLVLADTLRYLSEERRAIVRQLLSSDSARFSAGDIAQHNLLRTESELARADADVARARITAQRSTLLLQALMGVPGDTTFAVEGDLQLVRVAMPSDSALQRLAAGQRPDVGASRERLAQSDAQRSLAAAALVPIPQLSYVRQFTAPFESGHYYAFGIGFEIPIVNFYGAQRERAAAETAAARAAAHRTALAAQRDVLAASTELRSQERLVDRIALGVVAKSDVALEATRYAYARGAASLLDVLDALRAYQDVRTDLFTALHDYWLSIFALQSAAGSDDAAVGSP